MTLSSASATFVYTHRKGLGLSYSQLLREDDRHVMGEDGDQVFYSEPLNVTYAETHARNWALHSSSVWMFPPPVLLADLPEDIASDIWMDSQASSSFALKVNLVNITARQEWVAYEVGRRTMRNCIRWVW